MTIEQKLEKDNVQGYRSKIPGIKEGMDKFDPNKAVTIDSPVSPYSISMVAGIPLFRTHDLQADYNSMIYDLNEAAPGQFPYDNLRTHIALGVLIRNSPGRGIGNEYVPTGDKKQFYADYLDVFRGIDFKPFSVKAESVHPNGVILWNPQDNEEAVFDIRRQITYGLMDKKKENPDFYFEVDDEGDPKVSTGIVHSTFLRFADRGRLVENFEGYQKAIDRINLGIREGAIFRDPVVVDEISFIEARVSRNSSARDWYNDKVISRRSAA